MHNLSCENEVYLHENEDYFSYQGRSTSPHFDTKARGNSEMVYYLGLTRTILLHYPISTEIRTVDSQSDLRIFL